MASGSIVPGNDQIWIVETRQWKLSYSPTEKAKFDLSDEPAFFIEVTGDENGVHMIPWNMLPRITVNEGEKL